MINFLRKFFKFLLWLCLSILLWYGYILLATCLASIPLATVGGVLAIFGIPLSFIGCGILWFLMTLRFLWRGVGEGVVSFCSWEGNTPD